MKNNGSNCQTESEIGRNRLQKCISKIKERYNKNKQARIASYKTDNPIVNTLIIIACGLIAVFASKYMEFFALGPNQINEGKYYTLLTYIFFHNGKAHFLGNMITLIICGTALEDRLGNIKYLIFVLLTSIFSGAISVLYDIHYGNLDNLTVGISGTEYAIMAALCVHMLYRKQLGSLLLIAYIIYEIVRCFADSQINNICHIGGAISGIIISLLFLCWDISDTDTTTHFV